ncbi:hypothetical protein ES705_17562 [subsurface metagenome]
MSNGQKQLLTGVLSVLIAGAIIADVTNGIQNKVLGKVLETKIDDLTTTVDTHTIELRNILEIVNYIRGALDTLGSSSLSDNESSLNFQSLWV